MKNQVTEYYSGHFRGTGLPSDVRIESIGRAMKDGESPTPVEYCPPALRTKEEGRPEPKPRDLSIVFI